MSVGHALVSSIGSVVRGHDDVVVMVVAAVLSGDPVTAGGRAVGRLGTVVDHFELGPVALALVKRTIPVDTALEAGPCAASIDPDSIPAYDDVQAGRAAVDRFRGR